MDSISKIIEHKTAGWRQDKELENLKGTVSVISSAISCKDANARLTMVLLNLYLINNVEDIVVIMRLKVLL